MKAGSVFESEIVSGGEYRASKGEYHVYPRDAVRVGDPRYVALRANCKEEFDAFVVLKDKKNVTLDFGGAVIVMHAAIQPFLIDSCENVTIRNCSVTYKRPPYTEALITEAGDGFVRLRLNENCPCRVEDGKLVPYSESWENRGLNRRGCFFQVFDAETREGCGLHLGVTGNTPELDPDWPYRPLAFTAEEDGGDVVLRGPVPDFYRPGRVLVIAHENRSLSTVFAVDTKNLTLENFRILSGWGMGFYSYRAENVTLDGFRLTRDASSPCVVANSADAVHTFGTSGCFVIKNSVFEGMIDDALNVHSNFRTVDHVRDNEIYSRLASCEAQADDLYRVGDVIAVYRGKTMEESARYTVTGIEKAGDGLKKFTVDRPVEDHAEGDLIECLTSNCDLTVENCTFGKANSHLRLQTRGRIVMRDCDFELPVDLTGDASFWFESGPVTDLTIQNCRFKGRRGQIRFKSEILSTEAAPYYHRNVKIIDNVFDTETPVVGGYADGIVFRGNRNSAGLPMTLKLTNCGSVDAPDCRVERISEIKKELRLN